MTSTSDPLRSAVKLAAITWAVAGAPLAITAVGVLLVYAYPLAALVALATQPEKETP